MRVQDAFTNCCEGVKSFASSAVEWMGKTVSAIGAFIADGVKKIAEFVKPHFEHLKTFAQENKQSIIVAAVAFTVGAVLTAIITQVFCRGSNASGATTTTSSATV